MLRNTNFEHGSEANHADFSFPKEDNIEVEGMKDEYVNESTSKTVEKINYQEEEGVNNAIYNFDHDFPNIDINNKKQMLDIQSHIVEAYEESPASGAALVEKLNNIVAEQLPRVQKQEQVDYVNEMAKKLKDMTMEDIDKGIAKGHAA